MQRLSPTFAALEREIDRHVARFVRTLQFALGSRELAMTDCWVNIMRRGAVHALHYVASKVPHCGLNDALGYFLASYEAPMPA